MHLHMSTLKRKVLKGLQPFPPMRHAKEECCFNNSGDDFHIIVKEKYKYLIRLKECIFINHFDLSLNTMEGNAELVLFTY